MTEDWGKPMLKLSVSQVNEDMHVELPLGNGSAALIPAAAFRRYTAQTGPRIQPSGAS